MRQIVSPEDLRGLLGQAPPPAFTVGALDVAPPDAVLWLQPLTLGEAIRLHCAEALRLGTEYSEVDGHRALLAAAIMVDPEAWRLPPGPETSDEESEPSSPEYAPERWQPFFDDRAAVDGLGDPTDGQSPASELLYRLQEATGLVTPDPVEPAATLEEARVRSRHRGSWVRPFTGDLEAALFVRAYTEAERAIAQEAMSQPVGGKNRVDVGLCGLPVMLSHVVRGGPGGPPLLTVTEAMDLPYGAALALNIATHLLVSGADWSATSGVRFRRDVPLVAAEPGGGDGEGVVDGGEAAPPADGTDGGSAT